MYKKNSERGQILLIVVITMIVALTVGLTIASRTVTELRLSRQNEESQRAFNAAEAGIDRVLQQGEGITLEEELGNNSTFVVSSDPFGGPQLLMNNGEEVDQNVGADLWLSDYEPVMFENGFTGQLTIYWGDENQTSCSETNPVRPALEIVVLQGSVSNPDFNKYLYDTCSGRTAGTLDGATNDIYTIPGLPGITLSNRINTQIPITNGILAKVIPLYNSTTVAVVAQDLSDNAAALPSQGSVVESTGASGETERKITFYQSYPQMPIELFPYSIISQ